MKLLRFVLGQVRDAHWMLATAIIVGALSGVASVGLVAAIQTVLRDVEKASPTPLIVAFGGLCVIVTVARVGSQYLLANVGQSMVMKLRVELTRRILTTPLKHLEEVGPNRLLAALTDDINAIAQSLTTLPVLCVNGAIVAGSLGYLAWLDWRLSLIFWPLVVLGAISYQIPVRFGARGFQEARACQDTLFGHFRALTDGVKELKLNRRRRDAFVGRVEETTERIRRQFLRATLIFGTGSAWGHLLFFVVLGFVLFSRDLFVHAEPATLIGYTIVVLYMMAPLQILLANFPILGRAEVAIGQIGKLQLSLVPGTADARAATATDRARPWPRPELVGVTCTYRREGQDLDFRLGPIDLSLNPGELLFLVGGNGSGKTTLAKLLTGLYSPESGVVRMAGRPVTGDDIDDYRQHFSVIFDDHFLFDELLGLDSPHLDAHARRYLANLRIDHKVKVCDGKLSTTELSKGQRKRLALLIAYLEDRPIYVFDEWAADQDPIFKEVFYRGILSELKRRGKSVVVISHDDRYFHYADRVFKLEDGKLCYSGSYENMLTSLE